MFNTSAEEQGYRASVSGQQLFDNPYDPSTEEHKGWEYGFQTADMMTGIFQ